MSDNALTESEEKLTNYIKPLIEENPLIKEDCVAITLAAIQLNKVEKTLQYIENNLDSYTYEGICEVVLEGVQPVEIVDDETNEDE